MANLFFSSPQKAIPGRQTGRRMARALLVLNFASLFALIFSVGESWMRAVRPLLVFAWSLVPVCGSMKAQQPTSPRPVAIGDLFVLRDVHDPQISPEGQWIAYSVGSANLDDDKFQERIWMSPAAGGDAIPLTAEDVSSSHPRWSPDGKFLAFLSARNEGKTQVWLLNRKGGEAQKLTDTPQDVDDFEWAPDSKRLVLVLRDPTPDELEAAKSKDKDKSDERPKNKKPKTQKPWVLDRLQFKRDTIGYLDRRRKHLYVFDVAAKSLAQITSGDFDDDEPAWSPDGTRIAFTSNRSVPDPDRTYNSDIWMVAADNKDQGARLTQVTSNPGDDHDAV